MRLLYCQSCEDIIRLQKSEEPRHCACGRSFGRMTTSRFIEVGGPAVILGLDRAKVRNAMENNPPEGRGKSFHGFVMPTASQYVTQV